MISEKRLKLIEYMTYNMRDRFSKGPIKEREYQEFINMCNAATTSSCKAIRQYSEEYTEFISESQYKEIFDVPDLTHLAYTREGIDWKWIGISSVIMVVIIAIALFFTGDTDHWWIKLAISALVFPFFGLFIFLTSK